MGGHDDEKIYNRFADALAAAVRACFSGMGDGVQCESIGQAESLRAEASSEAISYGKYYNGTQVELLSGPKNGWYRVRVGAGNGVCDVEGYMLAKYLAVGNAAGAVQDARPRVTLSSSSGSVLLRDFHSGGCVGKVQSGRQVTVLGVGIKYLHVLTDDGTCGMALLDCATPRLEF